MRPKAFEGDGGLTAVLRIRVLDQVWSEISFDMYAPDIWKYVP